MNMAEGSQSSQFFKAYYKTKPRGRRGVNLLLFLVFLIASGAGIVYWLGYSTKGDDVKGGAPAPTEVTVSSILPTSSVSAVLDVPVIQKSEEIDRGGISIAVLNGSGKQGAASGTASYLKGLGYNVVKTDNASAFDYVGVSVFVKKSYSRYALVLKKDLAEYAENLDQSVLRSSVSASVSDNITYDAEVIVGR